MKSELIAPCGMDCSICSAYLAFSNAIPKKRGAISHCIGCRPRNKQCVFLKGHCSTLRRGKVEFCFQCRRFPCNRLSHLDRRYRRDYGMSLIRNLEEIRSVGVAAFVRRQAARYSCARCGRRISVHNKQCFVCDKVAHWKKPACAKGRRGGTAPK